MDDNKKNDCEICGFRNPKATVTAVIIKDGKILLGKRTEEPFKDMWDLIGGYMNEGETPEEAISRELFEELGLRPAEFKLLDFFPGTASWKDKTFPVLSIVFSVVFPHYNFKRNEENSELRWFSREELPEKIAFDSNNNIIAYVKNNGLI
ncbi:NUDIX hydrolase [bacterium]|nr:NUDIX hydrolase [bacterium]